MMPIEGDLGSLSLFIFLFIFLGADRCLVCLAVFKTVVRSSKLLGWVRFPHVPAIYT